MIRHIFASSHLFVVVLRTRILVFVLVFFSEELFHSWALLGIFRILVHVFLELFEFLLHSWNRLHIQHPFAYVVLSDVIFLLESKVDHNEYLEPNNCFEYDVEYYDVPEKIPLSCHKVL